MSYATERVILFDRNMIPLDEIAPDEIFSRVRTEEINGEHSLVLVTTRRLQEGWRALTVDGTGKWREWVVTEIDEEHSAGNTALGTYHFVWSLQYDLTMTYTHTHTEIGYGEAPNTAGAVAALVCQQTSWAAGTCTAADIPEGSGAVFIYESAWSKLSKAVECMNCEVDATIEVTAVANPNYDLTTPFYIERYLNLLEHVGSKTALRRFDWNEDLTSIKRTPDPGPYYCRVVPLGKRKNGKEYAYDDKTEFDWPLDITEETSTEEGVPGPYYIEDAESALAFRRMNSAGTWVYPTIAVSYDEDDPELLLNAAQEDLHNHTRPGVTYEANVIQFARAGMDVQGVALGDEVQVVDYGFNPDAPLRVQGRVIKIEVDELSPETTTELTIGQLRNELTDVINNALGTLNAAISSTNYTIMQMTTAQYIDELIDRINAEINAGGGYTYLVPGEGLIVYDKAVTDPLIGSEADSVVQIKDGAIRIANSRKTQFDGIDDWNWRSVFRSGLIATDVLNATNIITGLIQDAAHRLSNGDPTVGNYWDLDGSTLVLNNGTIIADLIKGGTLLLGGMNNVSGVLLLKDENNDTIGSMTKDGIKMMGCFDLGSSIYGNTKGNSVAALENGAVYPVDADSEHNGMGLCIRTSLRANTHSNLIRLQPSYRGGVVLYANSRIELHSQNGYRPSDGTDIDLNASTAILTVGQEGVEYYNDVRYSSTPIAYGKRVFSVSQYGGISAGQANFSGTVNINPSSVGTYALKVVGGTQLGGDIYNTTGNATFGSNATGSVHIRGSLYVGSTKSRLVDTENYSNRLLYSYETPTPMFGDVGSSTIGEDGFSIISIDDIFRETVKNGGSYQVFLQECGEGKVFVYDKQQAYFIVKGTPNLKFDWEIKAAQKGFEATRLENYQIQRNYDDWLNENIKNIDGSDLELKKSADEVMQSTECILSLYNDPIAVLEQLYDEERAV